MVVIYWICEIRLLLLTSFVIYLILSLINLGLVQVYWLQFGRYFARGPVVNSVCNFFFPGMIWLIVSDYVTFTLETFYRKEMTMPWSWPWLMSKQCKYLTISGAKNVNIWFPLLFSLFFFMFLPCGLGLFHPSPPYIYFIYVKHRP